MINPPKYIKYCGHCKRYEFVEVAGPFFYRCLECYGILAREF